MKIEVFKDCDSQSQNVEVEGMKIDTSKQAKLFHMLSSTLYSNKIAAVIRELASNGYDSHKANGNLDRPIEITAPTYESLEFKIRDYGVGLTGSEARDTILCYLGSSKDTSNDFIGGWGIGSKSPFAYAKNYTVICFKNGIRYEFFCWKDEHGLPTTSLVSEDVTDEHNGVEMRLPVEPSDIGRFTREIREYLFWTNYNIKVVNSDIVARQEVAKIKVGGYDVVVYKTDKYLDRDGRVRIVYGGYSYKFRQVIADESTVREYDATMNLLRANLQLVVLCNEPGALTFNMNREELEMTERTKKWVRGFVVALHEEVTKRVEAHQQVANKMLGDWSGEGKCNLKKFQSILDKLEEYDGSEMSKFISTMFRTVSESYKYSWIDPVKGPRFYRGAAGASPFYSSDFVVGPLLDQIKVFWSSRASFQDRNIHDEFESSECSIYVKADTEAQAREIIAKMKDFEGMDITALRFFEVAVKPKAARKSYSRSSTAPRIRCAYRKEYIPWNKRTLYLMVTPDQAATELMSSVGVVTERVNKLFAMYSIENTQYFSVKAFVPSSGFLASYGDFPNFMWLNEFSHDTHEMAKNAVEKYGIPTEKDEAKLNRLSSLLYSTKYDHGKLTSFIYNKVIDEANTINDFLDKAKQFKQKGLNVNPRSCKAYHTLLAKASQVYGLAKKCNKACRYVDINALSSHLSKDYRPTLKKAAEDFIAKAKIEQFFK